MEEKRDITTIQISKKLKDKLSTLGKKGETYEEIIWKLVKKLNRKE